MFKNQVVSISKNYYIAQGAQEYMFISQDFSKNAFSPC